MKTKERGVTMGTGLRGVYKNGNRYKAEIYYNGKQYYLGSYDDIKHAIEIRQEAIEMKKHNFEEWHNKLFGGKPTACNKMKKSISTSTERTSSKGASDKISIFDAINERDICYAYLDKIAEISGVTIKEHLLKLIKQDMLIHPDIIEEIRGVSLC